MSTYALRHRGDAAMETFERAFEANSDEAALAVARQLLSDAYGLPGAHVMIDELRGRVTVGAGYRSHRGSFELLRPDAAPSPALHGPDGKARR